VHLEGRPPLRADAVVLASGHLDATPTADELDLAARAAAAGLRYLPPEQTTDTDLAVLAPGETALVRGLGLAFIDLVVLLYEGRGGRFEPEGDGLRYVPSGNEPYLVAGSPRGAPYHAKTHYQLRAGRPPLPRFLGPAQTDPLIAAGKPVDMDAQVWPLMAKEIAWGWYHELGRGHPERMRPPWPEFVDRFAALDWGTPAMDAFLAQAVPDPLDRLDLDALNRPLDGVRAGSLEELQPLVRAQIAEDLRQHVDERHTPHLGAFVAMLSVYAGMEVEIADGAFRATSAAIPEAVTTDVLVDARLPDPSASRSCDPMVTALMRDGLASEEVLRDEHGAVLRNTGQLRVRPADGALVDAAGRAHPRRFAIGPHTTVRVAGAFTRPGMNAQSLRYNDAVARAVLRALAADSAAAAAA